MEGHERSLNKRLSELLRTRTRELQDAHNDGTVPHAVVPYDGIVPHAVMPYDGTVPHADMLYDGTVPHAVMPYDGTRYSIVFFTRRPLLFFSSSLLRFYYRK